MTSITQHVPNYVGGISQQPDELKVPGQLRTAKNVLPDVTHGLLKRPGGRLIGNELSPYSGDSKWFHYYRDENEQYIGQIQLSSGEIKMWKCSDGTACTVNYESGQATALKNYLKQTNSGGTIVDSDIQTLTLNDYTYINNRNKPVAMLTGTSDKSPVRPSEAYIELKKVAYANQYSVNLFDDTTTQTITTATRIDVKRAVDSSNSCRPPTQSDGTFASSGSDRGAYPASGIEPGTSHSSGTYTIMCDSNANYSDLDSHEKDSYCPNVDTRIFKISHGDAINSTDINGITGRTYTVSGSGTLADRKELFFRITTTGQSVPQGESETPKYYCRYTTTYDLLNGGSGWQVGDTVQVWMKNARYDITIMEISTSKVQANLSLARPEPTPFDTKTVVTPESILGNLRTAIFEGGDQIRETGHHYDYIDQIGNGLYIKRNTDAAYRHVYSYGDISGNQTFNINNFQPAISNATPETQIRVYFYNGSSWSGTDVNSAWTNYTVNTSNQTITLNSALQAGEKIEIFQTNPSLFNISTPSGDLLNVITSKVDDVANLPTQCKHGYVVEVTNSEADEDNYYVKFFGNNDKDGDGAWEECPKPDTEIKYDPSTLPIQLIREANGTFTVKQVTWEDALVGDTAVGGTNPRASFVKTSDGLPKSNSNTYVGTINKMLFFRNRLVMLSDENVIMSQPGEFFNFWAKSAITYTATDMIDISLSSEYPAIVYDGIQVNSGLVLFTKNQQFMLTTDSDVLNPLTAKINALSSYNFNFESNPISLGTTIAFLDNAGKYTRFFEMQAVLREGEPNVIEQSKNIAKLFLNNIDLIANSRENSTIFFATKGTNKLYGFRYYQTGERRVQQAWFEWELSGTIQHIAMLDDALYAVVKNTGYTMQKFSLKLDDNSHTLVEDETYRVHLDNAVAFQNQDSNKAHYTTFDYVADEDYTKLDHTAADFSGSGQLYAVAVSTGTDKEFNGLVSKVTTFEDASDSDKVKVKIPGNWTTSTAAKAFNVVIGYAFDMEVEFPTFYVQQQQGERFTSDVQSSLVLHRIKLSLGPTGVYDTTIQRIGKPNYDETFESVMADAYTVNTVGIDKEQIATLPVYEKNTNLTLTLKSTHPSPATLYSLNWEGDYTNKYYKRV